MNSADQLAGQLYSSDARAKLFLVDTSLNTRVTKLWLSCSKQSGFQSSKNRMYRIVSGHANLKKEITLKDTDVLTQLKGAVETGDRDIAVEACAAALAQGITASIVLKAVTDSLDVVGRKYQSKEYFLTELILSATAAEAVIKDLTPLLHSGTDQVEGKVVLGTVEGDIHDLGKSIVNSMFSAAGFKVIDLGINVPAAKFAQSARENKADIVASCALLTTSKTGMKAIEEELVKAGIRAQVKTMIGGAAVSADYAKEIGADGYGKDAFEAVTVAKSLVRELRKDGR